VTLRHTCVAWSHVAAPHAIDGAEDPWEQPSPTNAAPTLTHRDRLTRERAVRGALAVLAGWGVAQNGHEDSVRTM
jgi:hypothetical protein